MKRKVLATVGVSVMAGIIFSSCSKEEQLRPIIDSDAKAGEQENAETITQGEQTEGNETLTNEQTTTTETTEIVPRPNMNMTIDKPADVPTEMWWLRSEIMDWFFNTKPGEVPSFSEEQLGEWTLYKNSDIESEEDYNQLIEQGRSFALQWLTGTGNEERVVLPPAEGVTLMAASAAKSAQQGASGEQLYRVAVLWSAQKDRYGKSVANQIVEMFFTGSTGNWRFVTCRDISPSACTALFQTIL